VRIQSEREEIDSEPVLGFVDAGNVLGELGLLDGQPRAASAYANEPVEARRFAAGVLDGLAESDPALAVDIIRYLGGGAASKLRVVNEKLIHGVMVSVAEEDPEVELLVTNAQRAQADFAEWPEEKVDAMLQAVAVAVSERAQEFAENTVKVTRLGNAPDKTRKNNMASLGVFQAMASKTGSGIMSSDPESKIHSIAAPVGVVFGLIPVTNPVATAVFKSLISLKARNAIILSFHRSAGALAGPVGDLMRGALEQHGAPADLIQWVKDRNSRKKTAMFFEHPGVSLILATGGKSMVKAAYSAGKPAIGVGPGNAPALICSDADLGHAAGSVVASKSFDNGLICGAEHNLVVPDGIYEPFVTTLEAVGAAVLNEAEAQALIDTMIVPGKPALRRKAIGQSAADIAAWCGIERDYPIMLIVVPTRDVSEDNFFAREKMAPLLGLFRVPDEDAGQKLSRQLLELEGKGHTAIIHSKDPERIRRFAIAMPASRILANSPGSQGVVGLTTGLSPSLTLGCGTYGGTSTTDNVTFTHLTNVKRLAEFLPPRIDV
jgi:acyl-CoA reductase-like NAD-dependent aldehyde dehydrogenase